MYLCRQFDDLGPKMMEIMQEGTDFNDLPEAA